ncbi:MAG: hypothetical protein OSJ54_13630 [Oscillospiraceae bacterium]|nr:hypothetical protein [Oscillospiraceae bacterium]
MNEKIRDFFKQNIGYFIVALVSVVYIATAFITVDETGKTIGEIIADTAVVFFLGLFINRVFDLQGMMNGDRDERVQMAIVTHGETVVKISPYIDKLDDWCKLKNEENLKVQRTRVLASEGMRYEDYFNEDGSAKDFKPDEEKLKNKTLRKTEKARIRCFKKALHLKLTPITAGALTSEGGKKQDPYNFGRTKGQYETQTSVRDIITKICIAGIFGYYGVRLIQDFNYATLIWNGLQVAIFLIMGCIKMYNSFMFVTGEYRTRIVNKTNNLEMFHNYIQSLPKEEVKTEVENEQ